MRVEGKCHCGKIAYEATVDPDTVTICHCTDCQTLTGSAYRANIPAPAESFVLLRGQPKIYIKTAESGTRRAHAFCPDCGTPIYATAVGENPPTYGPASVRSSSALSCRHRSARYGAARRSHGRWIFTRSRNTTVNEVRPI